MIPVPEARRSHRYLELPRHLAVGRGDLVQKDGVNHVGSRDSRRLTSGWSWMGASLPRSAGEVLKEDKSSHPLEQEQSGPSSRLFWKGNGGRGDGAVGLSLSSAPAAAAFSTVHQHPKPNQTTVNGPAWQMLVLDPRPRQPCQGRPRHLTSSL